MEVEIQTCYIFVPGLSEKYRTGGLLVIQDVGRILTELGYNVKFVATEEAHPDCAAPSDCFQMASKSFNSSIFLTTWGPLTKKHIQLIQHNVPSALIAHYAQSFGWGVDILNNVPIVCVSRYVMAQFALHSPGHSLFLIPPHLQKSFVPGKANRDIDVLVHTRKQNSYCLDTLLPTLKKTKLKIETITEWIPQENFAALLQRTKIFLYITAPHKAGLFRKLPGEGFGLPALEAVACGAIVGSNLLGGVSDFLTPGENCISLQTDSVKSDMQKIEHAIKTFDPHPKNALEIVNLYSHQKAKMRWQEFLKDGLQNSLS